MDINNVTILVNNSGHLKCDSYGETKWLFRDGELPENVKFTGPYVTNILKIQRATIANSGSYKCYGLYPDKLHNFVAESHVHIYG